MGQKLYTVVYCTGLGIGSYITHGYVTASNQEEAEAKARDKYPNVSKVIKTNR